RALCGWREQDGAALVALRFASRLTRNVFSFRWARLNAKRSGRDDYQVVAGAGAGRDAATGAAATGAGRGAGAAPGAPTGGRCGIFNPLPARGGWAPGSGAFTLLGSL